MCGLPGKVWTLGVPSTNPQHDVGSGIQAIAFKADVPLEGVDLILQGYPKTPKSELHPKTLTPSDQQQQQKRKHQNSSSTQTLARIPELTSPVAKNTKKFNSLLPTREGSPKQCKVQRWQGKCTPRQAKLTPNPKP